eukprot:m51a1_g12447 hypothetical protein (254) ;mRNA; f:880633-899410
MGPVTAAIIWGKLTKELEINAASKNMEKNSILSEKPVMVNWNELVYPAKTPNRHIHYNLVVNFLLSKARDKFTSLLKSTFLALKSDPLELLHGSSKPTIDYTTIHDMLHFMSIAMLELTGDKLMHRHIHYNLVVNFLSSKARDKFTSLLKSTFLALKSDPLELLHGSSKPTIDYTTVHDMLHFMSIATLELTGDKPMHRVDALMGVIPMHFTRQGVLEVYKVIGSTELKGNPVGLFANMMSTRDQDHDANQGR